MSAKPLHATLIGAAIVFSTIAPAPSSAESDNTEWDVQELYKQCTYKEGSLDKIFCLEFVSAVGRKIFTNGLPLKDIRADAPSSMTLSILYACPKPNVTNDAMVQAFNEWANQRIEKWKTSARVGVMQAMSDTWPCF
jgi:hypothetical protein